MLIISLYDNRDVNGLFLHICQSKNNFMNMYYIKFVHLYWHTFTVKSNNILYNNPTLISNHPFKSFNLIYLGGWNALHIFNVQENQSNIVKIKLVSAFYLLPFLYFPNFKVPILKLGHFWSGFFSNYRNRLPVL